AEDGIRDFHVTGVQTCALPILGKKNTTSELNVDGNAVAKPMSQLIDSVEGLKSSGDSETNQVDNEFSSVSKDDIVEINTEKKTVEVTRTGDDYDRIFINGEEVAATPRGLLADGLKEMGFSISMKGPQGVGMGLTD